MSRGALLSSAVSFLRDPSTASSPLAQRIAFLESKGLTPPEIEQALATASGNAPSPQGYAAAGRAQEFERDWRDWFIMAVIGGTVGYVAVKLAKVSARLEVGEVVLGVRAEETGEGTGVARRTSSRHMLGSGELSGRRRVDGKAASGALRSRNDCSRLYSYLQSSRRRGGAGAERRAASRDLLLGLLRPARS